MTQDALWVDDGPVPVKKEPAVKKVDWIEEVAFASLLAKIHKSTAGRFPLIMNLVAKAGKLGIRAGFRGSIAYVDLPTGQVNWTIPSNDVQIEDVDSAEQSRRILAYYNDVMARGKKDKKEKEKYETRRFHS